MSDTGPVPELAWPPGVERVAAYLRAAGAEARIEELRTDVRTAEQSADAVGCTLGQVVKTIALECDGKPVVALVPGDRRADPDRIARCVHARRAAVASAASVLALTGFRPGAVAPFPLPGIETILVDRSLLRFPVVWAGAGSARHLVRLAPVELLRLTQGAVEDVALESA